MFERWLLTVNGELHFSLNVRLAVGLQGATLIDAAVSPCHRREHEHIAVVWEVYRGVLQEMEKDKLFNSPNGKMTKCEINPSEPLRNPPPYRYS